MTHVAQAAALAAALVSLAAGVLAGLGFDPADGLYWLYALLLVAFVYVWRRGALEWR